MKQSEIAKFTPKELREYENSLKAYRDIKNSIDTAYEQGIEKGIQQGIQQGIRQTQINMAKNMLSKGIDLSTISDVIQITEEELKKLL